MGKVKSTTSDSGSAIGIACSRLSDNRRRASEKKRKKNQGVLRGVSLALVFFARPLFRSPPTIWEPGTDYHWYGTLCHRFCLRCLRFNPWFSILWRFLFSLDLEGLLNMPKVSLVLNSLGWSQHHLVPKTRYHLVWFFLVVRWQLISFHLLKEDGDRFSHISLSGKTLLVNKDLVGLLFLGVPITKGLVAYFNFLL